jgi:simple sugar transport system permease protein
VFGVLQNGSRLMQLETGIPIEMLLFIQSLVIAFIAAPDLTLGIVRNPFQSVLRRIKK